MGTMNSLHGDCQCSLSSTVPPFFSDSLLRKHSRLIRRKPRSFTSTLVCSNHAQFRLSHCRRPLYVRATPNDDAAEAHEDSNDLNNADADPPRSFGGGDQHKEGDGSRSMTQLFTLFKNAVVSGTHRYMHEFTEELKTEAGLDLDAVTRAYHVCLAYIDRRLTPLFHSSKNKADELAVWGRESSDIFKQRVWPQFVAWNRPELWKVFD